MKIDLKYGRDVVAFEPPRAWTVYVVDHGHPGLRRSGRRCRVAARCRAARRLSGMGGREGPARHSLRRDEIHGGRMLLPVLRQGSSGARRVRILFALGNHRKQTEPRAKGDRLGCRLSKPSLNATMTASTTRASPRGRHAAGLEVALNALLFEAEAVVVTGAVSHHYLAGFGGGRKCIIPGIAAYQDHPRCPQEGLQHGRAGQARCAQTGVLEGNPMHEAIMEGIALIEKPLFLINTIFDDKKRLLNIFSGDIKAVPRGGLRLVSRPFLHNGRGKGGRGRGRARAATRRT